VLLTGGRGLLGTPLAAQLSAAGADVCVTDLPEVDVTDAASVDAAVSDFAPDVIVHLAAWTDVDGCESDPERAADVNGVAAGLVAEAAARAGARLLYVSTDYVFDGGGDQPHDEDDPVGPLSVYGRSKLDGELRVRASGATHWIARCQSIYGRGRKSFADAILARARAGEPLRVVTDQVVCPSYAPDLAEALASLIDRAPPGVYHVANDGWCSWYEFARAVLDESGLGDTAIEPITAAELGRPAPRPANSRFVCDRLAAATGSRPRPWRDALRAYLSAAAVPQGGVS
jgi:dTDP-4-dehydrorhamnose reductase